jgi:hypothetical protein
MALKTTNFKTFANLAKLKNAPRTRSFYGKYDADASAIPRDKKALSRNTPVLPVGRFLRAFQ